MFRARISLFLLGVLASAPFQLFAEVDCGNDVFHADKDHPTADDSNPGTEEQPFLTIQAVVDAAGTCVQDTEETKTARVKAAVTPYKEPGRFSGEYFGGVTVRYGGTSDDQRLIIEGVENEEGRPVIDQERDHADDESPLPGFFVTTDWVTIRNFEITQTAGPGIEISRGQENDGIIVEGCHIHHLYGQENIGGVRLMSCNYCRVINNIIHDIYSTRDNSTANPFTDEPYDFHSGVHGYHPAWSVIENNLIYNVSNGVFQKSADDDGGDSNTVRRNVIHHASHAAYLVSIAGGGDPPADEARFYDNVVYHSSIAVRAALQETESQSDGFKVYNNTVVNTDGIAAIGGMVGIEIFNNIHSGFLEGDQGLVFETGHTDGRDVDNEISFFDCNLYGSKNNTWTLERYGENRADFKSFSDWQGATGVGLAFQPDANSVNADPQFVDAANNDYSLGQSSPARSMVTEECASRHDDDPSVAIAGAIREGIVVGPTVDVPSRAIDDLDFADGEVSQ